MLPHAVAQLIEAGHHAPSADNIQPWQFVWDGNVLDIGFDEQRMSGHLFGARDLATELTIGAVFENIEQVGHGMDIALRRSGTDGAFARLQLGASPQTPSTKRLARVLDRHTNRWGYRSDPLPTGLIERVARMSSGAATVIVHDDRRAIRGLARAVDLASRARFRTREIHRWLLESLRFDDTDCGDGLAIETLALPPGGAALMRWIGDWRRMKRLNRLGAYRVLAKVESAPVQAAPALVSILAPAGAGIEAGQLMQRVWIALNAEQIAVHPSFVVSDQIDRLARGVVPEPLLPTVEALEQQLGEIYGSSASQLRMLLRVGRPRRAVVPRSRRVPLQQVCVDLSTEQLREGHR